MPDALPAASLVAVVPPDPNCLLTLREVAWRLNVPVRYVRQLRQSGALPVVRLGARRLRVRPADLERYLNDLVRRSARRRPTR